MIFRVVIVHRYREDYFDFDDMAEANTFAKQAFDHQKGDDDGHDFAVRVRIELITKKEAEA